MRLPATVWIVYCVLLLHRSDLGLAGDLAVELIHGLATRLLQNHLDRAYRLVEHLIQLLQLILRIGESR